MRVPPRRTACARRRPFRCDRATAVARVPAWNSVRTVERWTVAQPVGAAASTEDKPVGRPAASRHRVPQERAAYGCAMKAVVCKAFGPPEDLVVESIDDPVPASDQLLVQVKAAAVVFPDTLMLQDKYQYKAAPPYIPGGEVAG